MAGQEYHYTDMYIIASAPANETSQAATPALWCCLYRSARHTKGKHHGAQPNRLNTNRRYLLYSILHRHYPAGFLCYASTKPDKPETLKTKTKPNKPEKMK